MISANMEVLTRHARGIPRVPNRTSSQTHNIQCQGADSVVLTYGILFNWTNVLQH